MPRLSRVSSASVSFFRFLGLASCDVMSLPAS